MDPKEYIKDYFLDMLKGCDCNQPDCASNYKECQTVPELHGRLLKVYRSVANARSAMTSDLVSGLFDSDRNVAVRRKLLEMGERATAQFAALEVLAMAIITTPWEGTPAEHLENLRKAGEAHLHRNFSIQVHELKELNETSPTAH